MAISAVAAGLTPLQPLASPANAIKRINLLMIRTRFMIRTVRPSLTFLLGPVRPRFLEPIRPITKRVCRSPNRK